MPAPIHARRNRGAGCSGTGGRATCGSAKAVNSRGKIMWCEFITAKAPANALSAYRLRCPETTTVKPLFWLIINVLRMSMAKQIFHRRPTVWDCRLTIYGDSDAP